MTPDKANLSLIMAEGVKEVHIPVGAGIAGGVAEDGKLVNIPDCYADSRFDPSFDKKTGYKTNNMLVLPIKDSEGEILGVLQVINKAGGHFNDKDEEYANLVAKQAAVSIKNAREFKEMGEVQRKLRSLNDLVKSLQAPDQDLNSMLFTTTERAPAIVDADRCTVFLLDEKANSLWAMDGEVNVRLDLDAKGIACAVAKTGASINIPDAYADERFNQDVDRDSGYKTDSILCLPIKAGASTTVGVIQLINKTSGADGFTEEDEEIMTSFLDLAGPILLAASK